jgi:hypothetical protein
MLKDGQPAWSEDQPFVVVVLDINRRQLLGVPLAAPNGSSVGVNRRLPHLVAPAAREDHAIGTPD